ncbi:MAG: ABC transporter ATP-binding protein [Mesorhizobium sp.]|uniref:ABC transporter ATP-binding protein n=1 Tax=Mesorhizobium sp. TaxID=1871066 RepID=UPI00120DF710|nr:ABC transporter ATP-binding protein [Mesorhizobium sp.]TIU72242.1 MAG: ABC transporter ATP-binding protein [Mesorhizobium sp.]TIW14096.1 MAG: ABC transporter ATP-binding protein [Mesorhizobium sp.]TIX73752.1 MAG: ABC transporter ATP-binding protein [Mesorhizobium sp.]
MTLLSVGGVDVHYGQIAAVRDAALEIGQAEVVTLIGANGAGKSSLINSICRLRGCGRGQIAFNGADIVPLQAHQLPALGLVQVPEGRRVFGRLTVVENLKLGTFCRKISRQELEQDLAGVFDLFPRLAERRDQAAGTLSGGEQQMLAIGRGLMAKPRMLFLDEPSMGLAPRMIDVIYGAITAIAGQGVSLLIVEQNAFLALELAQRAYVMEAGSITLSGYCADLISDERVRDAYLGHAH